MINNIDNSNVFLDVSEIKSDSPVLNKLYENGEIDVVGAIYGCLLYTSDAADE